jgi:hypothetical protein
MIGSMAGKRPWGAGVFAATAVATLALFAARAGFSSLQGFTQRENRAVSTAAHQAFAHSPLGRPALPPDAGTPGRPATTLAVAALLLLFRIVSRRRTRAPFAAPRPWRWVRGPPARVVSA